MAKIEKMKKDKLHIILASQSERRREILSKNGIDFEVQVPKAEEKNIIGEKYSEQLVNECAVAKAAAVGVDAETVRANDYRRGERIRSPIVGANLVIVSCDTVVVLDGIIIGKPKDRTDAIKILRSLSDRTHIVASSVCVMRGDDVKVAHEITKVTFRKLSDKEIEDYVDSHKPFDKAGAYGIQDEGFDFAIKIDGNIDNVVGLPINRLKEMLDY